MRKHRRAVLVTSLCLFVYLNLIYDFQAAEVNCRNWNSIEQKPVQETLPQNSTRRMMDVVGKANDTSARPSITHGFSLDKKATEKAFIETINHNNSSKVSKSIKSPSSITNINDEPAKYAYAFVVGGCDPERPGYRSFVYNILVASRTLQEEGSKADVVAFF